MADSHEFPERRRASAASRGQRRGRGAASWILGAVLLVLVLAIAFSPGRRTRDDVSNAMPGVNGSVVTDADLRAVAAHGAIDSFARFVASARARDMAGPRHEYTAEGIRRLAVAINDLAVLDTVAGGALRPRIDALRERADALQRDPADDTHALETREAFLLAASVLESIQDRRFPDLDDQAAAVVRAADDVKARTLLTEQTSAIEGFFNRTSELLRAMRDPAALNRTG
jgi:hypothetical protein